jgi:hypothetical protein
MRNTKIQFFCSCFALANLKNLHFPFSSVKSCNSKIIYPLLLAAPKQKALAHELIKISSFLSSYPTAKQLKNFKYDTRYLKQYLKKFSYYYSSYCKAFRHSDCNLSIKDTNTIAINMLYLIIGN